jgi:uncharacterized protein YbaR (Trm112 family)
VVTFHPAQPGFRPAPTPQCVGFSNVWHHRYETACLKTICSPVCNGRVEYDESNRESAGFASAVLHLTSMCHAAWRCNTAAQVHMAVLASVLFAPRCTRYFIVSEFLYLYQVAVLTSMRAIGLSLLFVCWHRGHMRFGPCCSRLIAAVCV